MKLPVLNAEAANVIVKPQHTETELERWSRIYSGSDFYYGHDAGPVARRAVRYHQPLRQGRQNVTTLDAGCGEGQDLLYLAQSGYDCLGLDFTENGIEKAGKLLAENGQQAELQQADLKIWRGDSEYDLVLAVNCLQFLGADAPDVLLNLKNRVAKGGVIGLSMFARDDANEPAVKGTIYRWTLDEMLEVFSDWQPFEASKLWQWGAHGPQPFVTIIAGNLNQ